MTQMNNNAVSGTTQTQSPVEVFYAYSHEDEEFLAKLEAHLSLLKRTSVITGWYDQEITAGTEWKNQTNRHIESASIILLLVSADFLASDYCYDIEMKRAMERHAEGTARVIPVILRDCIWRDAPFGKLQVLPKNATPIKNWADQDEAFRDVVEGIKRAIVEITKILSSQPVITTSSAVGEAVHNGEKAAKRDGNQHQIVGIGQWQIVLDTVYEDVKGVLVEAIVGRLQELTADSSLYYIRIEPGSFALILQGTRQGYEALYSKYESGQITHLLGIKILSIGWNSDIAASYTTLQITANQSQDDGNKNGLQFLFLTDNTYAESYSLSPLQRQLIDRFIEKKVGTPQYDERFSLMMLERLSPVLTPNVFLKDDGVVLVLDVEAAQYPWELVATHIDEKVFHLALKKILVRQMRTSFFRYGSLPNRLPAERSALVIGDTKSTLGRLPGAKFEAEAVVRSLEAVKYHVTPLIQADPIEAFYAATNPNDTYNIMHLVGFGTYDPDSPARTGIIFDEGLFLSVEEFRRMKRIPDLVFINCCYLGMIGQVESLKTPNKFAACIAQELIAEGVQAVIVAGWVIDDAAAITFASTFYDKLLHGASFGQSALSARNNCFYQHPQVNTWGAYQCYGNPDFILAKKD